MVEGSTGNSSGNCGDFQVSELQKGGYKEYYSFYKGSGSLSIQFSDTSMFHLCGAFRHRLRQQQNRNSRCGIAYIII